MSGRHVGPVIAQKHPVGSTITDKVVETTEAGAFVHVFGKFNGFIPRGAMFGTTPTVGDTVEVEVTRVDPVDRKITLGLQRVVSSGRGPALDDTSDFPTVGTTFEGEVTKIVPAQDGKGGYALVSLRGYRRHALLPMTNMKPDLRQDFENGHLEVGDLVVVEATQVQPERRKVVLRDVGEADLPTVHEAQEGPPTAA